jgi:serine/arginine repetitive matrix protein 2
MHEICFMHKYLPMSYNGIGLSSVRGSGTSGHIQRNLAEEKFKSTLRKQESAVYSTSQNQRNRQNKPNVELLEHERKRALELKLVELRIQLEDDGISQEEIENRVEAERKRLSESSRTSENKQSNEPFVNQNKSQRMNTVNDGKIDKLRKAFRIPDSHVPGQAFDRELQEQVRAAKQAAHAQKLKEVEIESEKKQAALSVLQLATSNAAVEDSGVSRTSRKRSRSSSSSGSYSSYSSSSYSSDSRSRSSSYSSRSSRSSSYSSRSSRSSSYSSRSSRSSSYSSRSSRSSSYSSRRSRSKSRSASASARHHRRRKISK